MSIDMARSPRPDHGAQSTRTVGGLRIDHDVATCPPTWSTVLAVWAAQLIRTAPPGPVLQVEAGVGEVGLLAVSMAPRRLVLVDGDERACSLARRNAARAGIRADVRSASIDRAASTDERFSVVIADLVSVRDVHDPDNSSGARPGSDLDQAVRYRRCLDLVTVHLVTTGSALIHVDVGQADAALELIEAHDTLRLIRSHELRPGVLMQVDNLGRTWNSHPHTTIQTDDVRALDAAPL